MTNKEQFLLEIYDIGVIKFGEFILKSGLHSPIYIDLRPIASKPNLLKKLAALLSNELAPEKPDLICGVPYAALPMATAFSLHSEIPLIIKRKKNKGYGTKRIIEGLYEKGQSCLLIEDVISSGDSLIETIAELEKEKLKIKTILVVLDRQQGGIKNLIKKGYEIKALFNISELFKLLKNKGILDEGVVRKFEQFFSEIPLRLQFPRCLSYEEKKQKSRHPEAQRLLEIVLKKKTNLIVSADLTQAEEILKLAQRIGDKICSLKLHADIISDFTKSFIQKLKKLAREKDFLLIEDRKLADIGKTSHLQLHQGVHEIASWADIVTIHPIAGEQSLQSLQAPKIGLITILEMSSSGNLINDNYREKALKISLENPQVIGVVGQQKIDNTLLLFTPGVHLSVTGDDKGQQYIRPDQAIQEKQSDFIIVGRGIYSSQQPNFTAEEYRRCAWSSYEKSLG
ncbi:MAG: orotidine-5'-phosphate decarboxylase [Flavobacteriales bacterium Tduv]